MRKSIPGAAAIACVLALAGLARSEGRGGPQDGNIPVVRNGRKPVPITGVPCRPVFTEELTIGRGASEDEQLQEVLTVQADAQGRIYALDSKAAQVKVFDARGRFLRAIGKKGQGPGEFDLPGRCVVTPGGELAVLDLGNHRVSFFSLEGKLKREISTATHNLLHLRVNARGDVFSDRVIVRRPQELGFELVRFSPDLSSSVVLASEGFPQLPGHLNPFRPQILYGLTRDDGLAWACMDRYEITVLDPEGRPRRKIVKEPEPNSFRDEDRKEFLREIFGDRGLPEGMTMDFPDSFQPIRSLIVTDTDHILVRTNVRDGRGGLVHDVFDPAGRFVSQFALGENEYVMMVRDGKAYTIVQEDEDGIPLVRRYALAWR